MAQFNEFSNRDEAVAALARRVGESLRLVSRRAAASLIVSGDASRRGPFRAPQLPSVPRYLVTTVPSDGGWVPVDVHWAP